jgi:hypothetical protein
MPVLGEVSRLARRAGEVQRRLGTAGALARAADKGAVYAAYPVWRALARDQEFQVGVTRLPYFVHPYNATWRCERAIEIPLARHFLRGRDPSAGAEIGNVLSYYMPTRHVVVDKYERSAGVLNIDVVDYLPPQPLNWIVAVSTLEHVGWDESPREPPKVGEAISHLRDLLAPGGAMLVTCPRGYNSYLDEAIAQGELAPAREFFLTSTAGRSIQWHEEPREAALRRRPAFDMAAGRATDLWIAEFGSA